MWRVQVVVFFDPGDHNIRIERFGYIIIPQFQSLNDILGFLPAAEKNDRHISALPKPSYPVGACSVRQHDITQNEIRASLFQQLRSFLKIMRYMSYVVLIM